MAIKGFDKFKKQLQEAKKKYPVVIDNIVNANAEAIALEAKSKAPVDLGKLRQSGYAAKIGEMEYKVAFSMPYAAYMEFGTGAKVDVPAELSELAIKFKGQGIRQVNIRPRPFLYPAFVKGRIQLYKDLKKFVNDVSTTR